MDELRNPSADPGGVTDGTHAPAQRSLHAARRIIRQATALGSAILILSCCHPAIGQEVMNAEPAMFLRSNDHFGFELLRSTLAGSPKGNVVVSPLPISLAFAALWDGAVDADSAREIQTVFYWDHVVAVPAAAKLILERFQEP